jgi:hypothetical protein
MKVELEFDALKKEYKDLEHVIEYLSYRYSRDAVTLKYKNEFMGKIITILKQLAEAKARK